MRLHPVFVSSLVTVVMLGAACEDVRRPAPRSSGSPSAPPAAQSQPPPRPASPLEVVRALNARRMDGRYNDMAELLLPEQREPVLAIVRAVDELIAAEFAFREAVKRRLGEGSASYFARRDQVANILGPLSRDVVVLAEVVEGDSATVSFQVAKRVPVETVEVVRRDGVWYAKTDKPIEGLADALRDLANATRRVSSELEQRNWSRQQIARELDLRHAEVLKRIAELTGGKAE